MAAVMLQVVPAFLKNILKTVFLILQSLVEITLWVKKNYIAHHDEKMCFVTRCTYHITLTGDNKELLQKLDAICFNYQHVDCLYTLFKYRFIAEFVVKCGQLFDNMPKAVHFNYQNREMERKPRIATQRLLMEKYKKQLFSSFRKNKSTQISGSVFADRIEQVEKTKVVLELIQRYIVL